MELTVLHDDEVARGVMSLRAVTRVDEFKNDEEFTRIMRSLRGRMMLLSFEWTLRRRQSTAAAASLTEAGGVPRGRV